MVAQKEAFLAAQVEDRMVGSVAYREESTILLNQLLYVRIRITM